MPYIFQEIVCNNRTIAIDEILKSTAIAKTPFEHSLFQFIQDFLTGKEAFTLQTSGSTGTPKEIILTRSQLQQSAIRTIQTLNLQPKNTAFICLDTKYIAGKMMVVRAFEGQLRIIASEPIANPLLHASEHFDFIALVPLQLQEIIGNIKSRDLLNRCKAVIVGGAAANSKTEREVKKLTCTVYATYGMTETVSHIALQRLNGKEATDYFTTLLGITVEQDERGCLVIKSLGEKIITNDIASILSPTTFQLTGRIDHVINSGGFKVSPEKIEKVIDTFLEGMGLRNSFFISGIQDDHLGEKVVLVIEGNPLLKEHEESLFELLKKRLHPYEVPKLISYRSAFIRTETGKVNRIQSLAGL